MKSLSETLCAKGMSSTIYTSIYNINEGLIYLYLYHNYKQHCTFNLKDELAKGDHVLNIASLFQPNAEYEKFRSYKTLHNDDGLLSIFIFCALLFSFSSIFFLFSFFRNRKITNETNNRYSKVKLLLSAFDVLLLYYVVTLVRNEIIFYYPIQYIASYIPFLMLLLIYSLFRWNYKSFGTQSWTKFSNWLFALNNLSYLTLLVLFFYWLSYRIF